jgi:peptide/nickel transport system substrate-binding protein
VTASDVRFSVRAYLDPKVGSPTAPNLGNIDSVGVRDSLTAVVYFKKHTPEEFYDIAYQLFVMPEHVYGKVPFDQLRTSDVSRKLVGSGPFRFVRWDPKVRIELVADTANYHGRPKLDRVILTPIADANAGAALMLSGQADFMLSFPIDQVAKLDSSSVARAIAAPSFSYGFFGFNRFAPKSNSAPHPIFNDLRVRRALAMAINRTAMAGNVFGKFAQVSHGPFPMTLGVADSTLRMPPYDTAAAKAMLDSSGWKAGADGIRAKNGKPLRFSLMYPSTSLPRKQYAVLLQEALRRVGAQVDLDQVDAQTFQARALDSHDYDALLNAFNADPSVTGSKQSWGTSAIGPGGQNSLRYSNVKVDALLDTAAGSFDPARAKASAAKAYQQIIDDVPAVFLYDLPLVDAVNRRLTLAPLRADGWFANIADWSIPPDKRIDRDRIGLGPAKP